MTIEDLYQQASLSSIAFQDKAGVNRSDFELLEQYFTLDIPRLLSNQKRLFAILYAEKFKLTDQQVGQILTYKNPKRDGSKFIQAARLALATARQQLSDPSLRQQVIIKNEKAAGKTAKSSSSQKSLNPPVQPIEKEKNRW